MINGAIRRALQVAKMRKEQPQQSSGPAPQQAPVPRMKDMPVDPTRSKSAQERQRRAEGGDVWDKPRPKDLGAPKHLSKKKKASAKAAAKAAGRPYPNLIDNMRAAKADGGSVDEKSREKFLAEQLKDSAPQYDPEGGWETAKESGRAIANLTTPGAIADAAGYLGGPSIKENIKQGNYADAAMQGLGVIPVAGTLAKGALGAGLLYKALKMTAPEVREAMNPAVVRSFAGPKAKGVNLDTYRAAQKELSESTLDPATERSIASRYGWHPFGRDPKTGDLRLFTELSDAKAKFDLNRGTQEHIAREKESLYRQFPQQPKKLINKLIEENVLNHGVWGPLKDFYSNPAVFSAYPELENLKFEVVPKSKLSTPGTRAEYRYSETDASAPRINMAKSASRAEDAKKVLGHELQHGTQHIEKTLGPISDFKDTKIVNPALAIYEEALAANPKMQQFVALENSPEIARVKDIFRDQFNKRKSDIFFRKVNGVVDLDANKAALSKEILDDLTKHFPEYGRLRALEKELRDQGIPTAQPSRYLTDTQAYLTSQDEAQARATELRHDWDMRKRQMNYPKDTLPWDSHATDRLGFIPFNRLHNFADGGSVEKPTKMNDKVRHALDVALSETHPKRFHHTLAKTGYADGGIPSIQGPAELANEVPYTHDNMLASQFDVAKLSPFKPEGIKVGPTKIASPKKSGIRAPRSDIGKMRIKKPRLPKIKKFKLAQGGHPEIDDALRLASRTMADMAKGIKDEGVHGASMQQGSTSTIVKEKVPGKKAEIVYEHHAKTPTETEEFASGGGAWTRKEGKNPAGGLNAKGRASLRAQGHDIRPPAPHPKTEKDAARRKSFCARMSGMPGPMKDDNGKPTRKALSLRAWNCRADGGRLMHQDILDALNLAQRRRGYAVGGQPFAPSNVGAVQDNENYLRQLYDTELGRAADQGGMDYWLQQLQGGMGRDQVQQMFDQSQEGLAYNQQPPRFSNDPRNPHIGPNNPFPPGTTPDVMNPRSEPYAGNPPLPGGNAGISQDILNRLLGNQGAMPPMGGQSAMPYPSGLGGTGTKAGGIGGQGQGPMPQRTPLEEIDLMYRSQLGREADEGGRNYWMQQLQGGMPLGQIQQTFRNTPEGQAYQNYLRPMTDGPGMGMNTNPQGNMPYPSGLGGTGTKAGGGGIY